MKYARIASICATLAFTALATGASAGNLSSQTGVPHDWSGPYAGVQAGYAFGSADHAFDNGAPSDSSDPEGFVGGVHAGFLFQSNAMVFGIEGDIEITDIDGSFQNATGISSSGSSEIDLQGSIRGKFGYAIDRFMPYVTGGLAIADVDYGGGPSGGPCCGFSSTAYGWTIGGGVQYAFSDMVSGRLEYRYTDYGSESGSLSPAFPGVSMSTDLETHAIMAGVSIHFGGFSSP
jgi:outer membrane immunogenic protein